MTSLFGNFILKLALSMYILDATGSAAIFAGILSVATIPTIILSPLGGILADRINKRDIMVALDTLTGILKMLLLTALCRFFVMGITVVGLPYIVRTVLGLNAQYYGAAESTLAIATSVRIAVSIFSIFAVSLIQQKTPNHLIGKVMAYTSAITLCVQPIGQIVYGFLFDGFHNAVSLVLILSGATVCVTGLLAAGFFKHLENEALRMDGIAQ